LPEQLIKEHFSKKPFKNCRFPIFMVDCEDEGCELTGDFEDYIILNGDNIKQCLQVDEKSVDRIVFLKRATNNRLTIILCELSDGFKKYDDVVEKIKRSGEYIYRVIVDLGFKVMDFKCIYLGDYKNAKRVKPKAFSIPGFHRNDIMVEKGNCGDDLSAFL